MSSRVDMLWLEITGRCPLECPLHCYAESGPTGAHGSMSAGDWRHLVRSAAELGVSRVQLIGGEPTAHPAFPQLVRDAIAAGLGVEVFTNCFMCGPSGGSCTSTQQCRWRRATTPISQSSMTG